VEGALAWIGQIMEWIGRWFPRWSLLDTTEGAVKFEGFFLPQKLRVWCGGYDGAMRTTVLGPGMHWFWPVTTSFQVYPTEYQTDNLPSQTIETADGKTITVSGMITYRITDLGKLLPRTHSALKLVQVLTLAAVHATMCKFTFEQLSVEQRKGTLNTKLRNAAQKPLEEFGVKVEDCMLTDLTRSKVFRLIQSTQQDDA
jgi:regulator of protease activity HflC (stomatin/prohibitin superfamily)